LSLTKLSTFPPIALNWSTNTEPGQPNNGLPSTINCQPDPTRTA
jgi:hypothetical protein